MMNKSLHSMIMSGILYFATTTPTSSFVIRSVCSFISKAAVDPSRRKLILTKKTSTATSLLSFNSLLTIPTRDDMYEFGALLSMISCYPSSIILLEGDLGTGKTTLAQGFIQTASGEETQVTSPTYLLCNTYPCKLLDEDDNKEKSADKDKEMRDPLLIHHMDLYRLSGTPQELSPLNLPHVFRRHASLIEWPQRLGAMQPESHLTVHLNIKENEISCEDDQPREIRLEAHGDEWEKRIQTIIPYMDDWIRQGEDS